MKHKRAYQYRCYPTREQAQNLARTFGCARFVYTNVLICQEASPFPDASLIEGHTKPAL